MLIQTLSSSASTVLAINGFTPPSGSPGTTVTILGTQLDTVTAVNFAGVGATFVADSATEITAIVPVNAVTGANHAHRLRGRHGHQHHQFRRAALRVRQRRVRQRHADHHDRREHHRQQRQRHQGGR